MGASPLSSGRRAHKLGTSWGLAGDELGPQEPGAPRTRTWLGLGQLERLLAPTSAYQRLLGQPYILGLYQEFLGFLDFYQDFTMNLLGNQSPRRSQEVLGGLQEVPTRVQLLLAGLVLARQNYRISRASYLVMFGQICLQLFRTFLTIACQIVRTLSTYVTVSSHCCRQNLSKSVKRLQRFYNLIRR